MSVTPTFRSDPSRRAGLRVCVVLLCLLASALVLVALGGAPALAAEARVALLIGNGDYANSGRLRNPANDVAAMRARLEALGFDVEAPVIDADRREMGRAIKAFSRKAQTADTALIFYSGHGMEVGGRNYLIPVDAELRYPDDAEFEAIDLDGALRAVRGASRLSIVIVDACRNNTFPSASRSGAKGFAPVDAPPGQVIAFSTSPGTVAYDGDGALSPYTQALTEALERQPDVDVRILFTSLGAATQRYARAEQRPFARFGDMSIDRVTLSGQSRKGDAHVVPPIDLADLTPPLTPRQATLRNGFQVFGEVCGACHQLGPTPFGALTREDGPALTRRDVCDVVDMFGARVPIPGAADGATRQAAVRDHFPPPFRSGDGGAAWMNGFTAPPLTESIQRLGPEAVVALLTGYLDAEGAVGPDGRYRYPNAMRPDGIGMPQPLWPDMVVYADGSEPDVGAMARDVVAFIDWAASVAEAPRESPGAPNRLGDYCIADALPAAALDRLPNADPERGATVYRYCAACHKIEEDAGHATGNALFGVAGARIASQDGYAYSKALTALGETGARWDDVNLAAFLAKPKDFAPATKMAFAGVRRARDLADLIAFLKSRR